MKDANQIEMEGVFTPVNTKCPHCGFDLDHMPDAFIQQKDANKAEQGPSETKSSLIALPLKTLQTYLSKRCYQRVIFPFTKAKEYAAKRYKKRFSGRKIGQ